MRVCLFGGTFDPIHNAHLQIAEEAQKQFGLDRLLFVPAANPPHKDSAGLASYEDRFRMVELACAPFAAFTASRLEKRNERNYTVDTLERVETELLPDDQLLFLIGSDAFDELESWKHWKQVVKLTEFIVVSRPGGQYRVPENARVHRLDHLALPISSSTIRAHLAAGEPTPELPTDVRKYIDERGLYGSNSSKAIASP